MNVRQIKKASKQLRGSSDLFLQTSTKSIEVYMIKHNTNKYTTNPTSRLDQLISILSGHKYGRYLKVIASNQGIATDGLSKFIKSNNHHNSSQSLNETLIPLGWVIAKFPVDSPSTSWRWYLMPVKKALLLGIDARLQRKIFRLMEASNDE